MCALVVTADLGGAWKGDGGVRGNACDNGGSVCDDLTCSRVNAECSGTSRGAGTGGARC